MAKFLTENQLSFVKEAIQDELLKRGITAKICKFEERNYKLEVETESFQTYPVMFKKIHIYSHLSGFSMILDKVEGATELYIGLSFRYTSFSGGSNGTDLMDLRFQFIQGSDSIVKI
jgi:hypothetical protein